MSSFIVANKKLCGKHCNLFYLSDSVKDSVL
nr:MAG TPA: hypothetical protein [Caudoviricetes sp.]